MSLPRAATFQEALDIVETLPDEQQESLIDILRRRRIERRRDALAGSLSAARAEYSRGEVRTGSVEDLLAELGES